VITLFVVPGSNASMTARLMLEHKRLEYRRVDLIPTLHGPVLRLIGFPGIAVPAMIMDGTRVQGTLALARALERRQPLPRLFPADVDDRARVERAEQWGESVFQSIPRRLAWWAISHDRAALRSFADGARLHIPLWLAMTVARPVIWQELRTHKATTTQIMHDLRRLPELLDRIDDWIRDGVLGRTDPTAADFQIAPSIRLLMCSDQLEAAIAPRACGRLALRTVDVFPGHLPAVFPQDWLPNAVHANGTHQPTQ
jgi:glutathione S-transferase